jgi:Protein of unknown function (DUF1353)
VPFLPGTLTVRRVDASTWALVDELVYQGNRQRFVVPAGFETDFATVPRPVTWLVPRFGAYTLAAILHDWLVTVGIDSGVVTSNDADGIFRRVMRESGVPVIRRWLMWAGVRWGALANPRRRPGWLISAPGVLVISALAAPLVVPPGLLILPGLLIYSVAEALISWVAPSRAEELVVRM